MVMPSDQASATNVVGSNLDYSDQSVDGINTVHVRSRYEDERLKRLRDEGYQQYVEPSPSNAFQHFQDDPWVDPGTVQNVKDAFPSGRCRFLIFGAGFGGILYAIRLVQAGFRPSDIRIADTAGGFGGTWYWSRYPGLMCDIESYMYLPLLEETDYIPRHRYAYGDEIREYAELLVKKWNLATCGVFQTKGQKLEWDEAAKEWKVELLQQVKERQPQTLNVRSQFVALVNGPLNWPKLPSIPGVLDYKGETFHTSRWRYDLTGGSQKDPELTKLKDKRVAIVGTGATAVQIVPELAKWAKHVYVVQRTPASVDIRDQRKTDEAWFRREVAREPGWQRKRAGNFHAHFTTEAQPEENLVDDQWTHANGMCAVSGNFHGPQSVEKIPEYVEKLHSIDLPRQARIRDRVKQTVKDPRTAEDLLPWYPTWCKRPCFHDEYLETFNRDNVTLLDTAGRGLDRLTEDSLVVGDKSYPVDMIIWATGFRAPFIGSPAEKANITVLGRDGASMGDEWARDGPSTLHGVLDHRFPNLLLSGPWQAAISGNNLFSTDVLAQHASHIVAEADRHTKDVGAKASKPFAISATRDGVDDWGMQVISRAAAMAALAGCTPGYFNVEGDLDRVPPEHQMKLARSGLWGRGIEDFAERLEKWRQAGDMKGIEVRT